MDAAKTLVSGEASGATQSVLLVDVTPLTLGIETVGGVMSKIVTRGTVIPAKKEPTFTTETAKNTFEKIMKLLDFK